MYQPEFCGLVGLMQAYLDQHPDGIDRLKEFLGGDHGLWDTKDVMAYTTWGRSYVLRLCAEGTLPYIPGKPHRFIPSSVKQTLAEMQTGAGYGKKKSRKPRRITK